MINNMRYVVILIFAMFFLIGWNCANNKIGIVVSDKTGQSNTGVITKPYGTFEAGSSANHKIPPSKENSNMEYPEWEFVKVILILIGLMMILTEGMGNIPVLSFLSKKIVSILAMALAVCGYKILSSHSWLFLTVMGGSGWYLGNAIWNDFMNGSFWKGWLKNKK